MEEHSFERVRERVLTVQEDILGTIELTTLDYAARWGIEPMFSDFKSRGFGLEQSQLRSPDRLARRLLVMSLALHVAVSTGLWGATNNPGTDEKKPPPVSPQTSIEADCPGSPAG